MDHPTPLKAYRLRRNLTLDALGALIGATKSTVSKWERGRGPRPARALEIERATEGAVSKELLRPDLWASTSNEATE